MRQRAFRKLRHDAAFLVDDVVGGGQTRGHHVAGHVGHPEQDFADARLGVGELFGILLLALFQSGHALLERLGLVALSGFHLGAYLRGQRVEFGGFGVVVLLERAALLVESEHVVDGLASVKALDGQAAHYIVGIGFYLL